jgi:hypothetical protein
MANFLKNFKLKTSLLRVWFVKNLTVFLQLTVLISVVLVLTGTVDSNTPVLGGVFGELSTNIRDIIDRDYNSGTIVNLITVIFTLFVTIGTLSVRLERIALSDIKSPALKKALVQAGLYFNKDGKLVSRLEVAAKIDIDGDGKVGEVDIKEIPREKLLDGVKRASEEFMTIMNADIKQEDDLTETIEKANLGEAKAALGVTREDIRGQEELKQEATETANEEDSGITSLLVGVSGFFLGMYDIVKALFTKNKVSIENGVVVETAPVDAVVGAQSPIVQPVEVPAPVEGTAEVVKEEPTAKVVEPKIEEPIKVSEEIAAPKISAQRPAPADRLTALKQRYLK